MQAGLDCREEVVIDEKTARPASDDEGSGNDDGEWWKDEEKDEEEDEEEAEEEGQDYFPSQETRTSQGSQTSGI